MESRNPFSRLKKKVKNRLAGKKSVPDDTGDGAGGTGPKPADPPPPRPAEHIVADNSHHKGGKRHEEGGDQALLVDKSPGPEESGLTPGGEDCEPRVIADEGKSDWKPTASAAAKLLLRGVRDTADAFGPLKSVAGGLCFILENCEVRLLPSSTHDAHGFSRG